MTVDAEFMTGDPRWHNNLPGTSPLGLFFTGVEASGALSRDVAREQKGKPPYEIYKFKLS